MQYITSCARRAKNSNIYLKEGAFCYRVDISWAVWPQDCIPGDIMGAACDKEDNVYVTTKSPDRPICVFSSNGRYLRGIGGGLFDCPHGASISPKGTILVPDSGTRLHVIRELDMSGNLIRDYGTIYVPSDTGCDYQAFYHENERRSEKEQIPYDKNLEFSMMFDTITKTAGPFNRPTGVCFNSKDEIFFSDGYGNAAVHKFTSDGQYIKTWGMPGRERMRLRLPHSIVADKYDRIWIADRENSRAYVLSSDLEVETVIEGEFYRIASICVKDNYAYLAEMDGGLTIMDINSMEITAQFGYHNFGLLNCHDICVDSKGNLFISCILDTRHVFGLFRLERIL